MDVLTKPLCGDNCACYPAAHMVYPRACPSCRRDEPSPEQLFSTRAALDGGTPSPRRPDQPGRILDLRCGVCWALFRWDYFCSRLLEIIKDGDPEGLADAAAKTDN